MAILLWLFFIWEEEYSVPSEYSKTCPKRPLKNRQTKILMTSSSLMKVESIAECSPWSILQYFWHALSDKRSWKPFFVFFFSGRLRQVLLYLLFYEGWSKSSDRDLVALSRNIFERHTMYHLNEQALTFILMLVFSRCTVSFNNYSTLYMVHSIPLACFHVIEL